VRRQHEPQLRAATTHRLGRSPCTSDRVGTSGDRDQHPHLCRTAHGTGWRLIIAPTTECRAGRTHRPWGVALEDDMREIARDRPRPTLRRRCDDELVCIWLLRPKSTTWVTSNDHETSPANATYETGRPRGGRTSLEKACQERLPNQSEAQSAHNCVDAHGVDLDTYPLRTTAFSAHGKRWRDDYARRQHRAIWRDSKRKGLHGSSGLHLDSVRNRLERGRGSRHPAVPASWSPLK